MDGRALDELRRLVDQDSQLSEHALEARRLDDQIAAIRARAEAIEASLEDLPERRARARAELDAAVGDNDARRRELAEAEHAVAAARDDEAREDAERARGRAADHVAVAQARLDRAKAEDEGLELEAERLPGEAAQLTERAAALPAVAPPDGESSLVDWASHAHAELFVTAGQLDAQRDRVTREANELATMLVGEPTYGATAAQALARAEAHWVSEPGQVSDSK